MRIIALNLLVLASAAVAVSAAPGEDAYTRSTHGTRWLEGAGGLTIKVLVEASNLGSDEVEVGEVTFTAGSQGGDHVHGAHEIFYVLSGVLEHVVNGQAYRLEPGMVGIVRQGDTVAHRVVSEEPVKALVIWAPGGETERLAQFLDTRPVEADETGEP